MSIACFLVTRVNERTRRIPCPDTQLGCDCGGWDVHEQDWARVDTAEIILRGQGATRLPAGAMWWTPITEKRRPLGPDDWTGLDDAELGRVRALFAKHPASYRLGPSEHDPTLPKAEPSHTFADGRHLSVMTPGGVWNIDSRASNCGSPYDYEHRCWVRHGQPPLITVNKAGLTCQAGAGSIQCGSYHGFLQGGVLT